MAGWEVQMSEMPGPNIWANCSWEEPGAGVTQGFLKITERTDLKKMHLDILNVPEGYSFATSIQKVWTYLRICLTLSDSAALPEKSGLGHIKHAGCTTVSTAKVIYPPVTWQQLVICFTAPKFQARQWLPCCSLEREHWNNMAVPRSSCNLNEMK